MSSLSNFKISPFDFGRSGDRGGHCDDTEGGGPAGGSSAGGQQAVTAAARQLGLSVRQIKRLLTDIGQKAHRDWSHAASVDALSDAVRQEVLGPVRTHYPDFGPTLTCEKLAAHHGHKLSAETLRQWMIAEGLWKPRARKSAHIHQRPAAPTPPVSGRAGADRRLTQ